MPSNEMEQKREGWLETDERSEEWRGRSEGKVKERGNGNKISGTRAIDERERENRVKEQVNSGGGSVEASAERC